MKTKDEYLEFVKDTAERQVEALQENRFRPMVAFHLADDRVRLLFYPLLDRNDPNAKAKTFWAMKVLAASVDNLGSVAFVFDSYHTTQDTKTDGTPWGEGGMAYALENQTVDAQFVVEALTYQVIERDGTAAMVSLAYERNEEGITFLYDDAVTLLESEGGRLAGFFPTAIREAHAQPKLIEQAFKGLTFDDFDVDLETGRIHTLAAGVKLVLNQIHMPCMIPCHTEEEARIVKDSLDDGPFTENIRTYDQDQILEIQTLDEAFDQPAFGE